MFTKFSIVLFCIFVFMITATGQPAEIDSVQKIINSNSSDNIKMGAYKELAETLFLSERTVETHRKIIFRKTQTSGVIGLIKYAYEHKLI